MYYIYVLYFSTSFLKSFFKKYNRDPNIVLIKEGFQTPKFWTVVWHLIIFIQYFVYFIQNFGHLM